MNITIERASLDDVKDIVEVKNRSFYEDYIKYGESCGFKCTIEGITKTVQEKIVYKIQANGDMIGYISITKKNDDDFYLNSLCVVPEYENKGIGQMTSQKKEEIIIRQGKEKRQFLFRLFYMNRKCQR